MRFSALLFAAVAGICHAQSSFSPLRPPSLPLAVKSPYLNTWQQAGSDGGNGGYLAGQWPTFWMGQVTGWTGFIRVDNVTYTWLGDPSDNSVYVNQTAYEYTSTRSIFTLSAGGYVTMTVTFLSGVTPNDLLRSSLPYNYLEVAVVSEDGAQHNVQLYTDISAEWVSGDHTANAQWSYGVINGTYSPNPVASGSSTSSSISSTAKSSSGSSASSSASSSATSSASSSAASSASSYASSSASSDHTTITSSPATTYGTQTRYVLTTSVPHTEQPFHAPGQGHRPQPNQYHGYGKRAVSANSTASGVAYHQVYRQQQLNFSETDQQADWGYWYYATQNTGQLTHQSGQDVVVRGQFLNNSYLADTEDTNYRGINDDYPVFGFAVDIGTVGSTSISNLFQLSLHQHDCIQFEGADGNQTIPCMWTNYFDTDLAAVEYFYSDYSQGASLATAFDSQVATDSLAAGGQDYLSITSLAARQAFGALEFTNTPETPYVFLKEISSDGNVQTVDVIFPFHPIAIYTNPTLLKYMLDPLFINQEAGNWPYQFSIHDLGDSFPNATGHNDGNDEMQPLEECGNMIIMTLAYAQRANDNAYLAEHYNILKQWNEYLIEEALIPMNQISTDDFAGALANQTNLAIKGIIGIEAMAQIANRTGNAVDGANYTQIAHNYITLWQGYGTNYNASPPHTELNYNNASTYSLLYNLFGDAELGLQLVPESVYEMQSNFYPTVFNEYGVPLDTRHTYTKTDWEIFCASIASNSTKYEFTSTVAKWLNQTPTNFAFTDLYDTITGDYPTGITFIARPVVGGMYTFLALESAPSSGYVTPTNSTSS